MLHPPAKSVGLVLSFLGSTQISLEGQNLSGFSTRKSQALFIYLAVDKRPHSRDELATLCWSTMPDAKARKNLRDALSNLRKVVGSCLTITPQLVSFEPTTNYFVDVDHFYDEAISRAANGGVVNSGLGTIGLGAIGLGTIGLGASGLGASGLGASGLGTSVNNVLANGSNDTRRIDKAALRHIVRLYRGPFLDDFFVRNAPAFHEWVDATRESLHQSAIQMMLHLIQADDRDEDYTEGLGTVEHLLALDPLNDDGHFYKIKFLSELRENDAALRHYEAYCQLLEAEPSMQPLALVTDLIKEVESSQARDLRRNKEPSAKQKDDFSTESHPASSIPASSIPASSIPASSIPASSIPASSIPASSIPHNLSSYPTAFIERTREMDYLCNCFSEPECRLLTIVAPGGMGKTRLAIEAGLRIVQHGSAQSQNKVADGVFFVPLVDSGPPANYLTISAMRSYQVARDVAIGGSQLVMSIADALGLEFDSSQSPKEQLVAALCNKKMLLILDNFEHLVAEAPLLIELITAAPNLRLLVTSREPLNLYAERLLYLSGLSTVEDLSNDFGQPAAGDDQSSNLFLNRRSRLNGLADKKAIYRGAVDARLVQQIGRLVGGVPLALELAAALSLQMPLTELVGALGQSLTVLHADSVDLPERHQSIQAILDVTWQTLSPLEQQTLVRLSVFQSGFTLDAAQAVVGATLPVLSTLVNKSILWITGRRYRMHALIYRYAAEKFSKDDQWSTIGDHHRAYYQSYLEEGVEQWRQTHESPCLTRLTEDFDNIMAGWRWLLVEKNPPLIVRYVESLWQFSLARGRLRGVEVIIKEGLSQIRTSNPALVRDTQAELLQILSATYIKLGDIAKSEQYGREALQLLGHQLPSSTGHLLACFVVEFGATILPKFFVNSTRLSHGSRALLLRSGPRSAGPASSEASTAWIYSNLSQNSYLLNKMVEAALYTVRAVNLAEQTTNDSLKVYTYSIMSILCGFLRLKRLNAHYMQLATHSSQMAQDLTAQAATAFFRGLYEISMGQCDQAKVRIESVLSSYQRARSWRNVGDCFALLNVIACHQGYHEQGLLYGRQLETMARDCQNIELLTWGFLIQAVNLLYLDRVAEAMQTLDKLEPLYEALDFKDLGVLVGYSTRALAHFRLGHDADALGVAEYVTTLSTRSLPTSAIYLYVTHAILEVLLGLWAQALKANSESGGDLEKQTSQRVKMDREQAHLKKLVRSWLRKLRLLSWIHPIGQRYFWLHQGKYFSLMGDWSRARKRWQRGLFVSQYRSEARISARFHYLLGQDPALATDVKSAGVKSAGVKSAGVKSAGVKSTGVRDIHFQVAIEMAEPLEAPYDLALYQQALNNAR